MAGPQCLGLGHGSTWSGCHTPAKVGKAPEAGDMVTRACGPELAAGVALMEGAAPWVGAHIEPAVRARGRVFSRASPPGLA